MSLQTELYQAACRFREWGLSVFPVDGTKVATVRWAKRQNRRPTERKVRRDFHYAHPSKGPACGIAVVHGSVSRGLACRDFDIADAYHDWAASHPTLAASLPTVATRRGFHVWFRTRKEAFHTLPDGELRADCRHYSVLPPSVRTDAAFVYRWHRNEPTSYRSFPIIDPVRSGLVQHTNANASVPCCVCPPTPPLSDIIVIPVDDNVDRVSHDSFSALSVPVQNAIRLTIPGRVGERNRCVFHFARRLKAINPGCGADDWADAVRAWWSMALPTIGTKEFAATWADFVRAWADCRPFVGSDSVLLMAKEAAAGVSGSDGKVLTVCRVMGGGSDDGRFMLSSTLAADLAGLSQKTAYNTLMRLVSRGELLLVSRSKRMAKGVGHVYRLPTDG